MHDTIRIGIISTLDKAKGTAQVYYQDTDNTTAALHLFAFSAEFSPPAIGDQVIVLHLPNDTSSGVILGRFWSEADPPPADVDYKREMGGGAYELLRGGEYTVCSQEIRLSGNAGEMTLSELINLKRRVEALERKGE